MDTLFVLLLILITGTAVLLHKKVKCMSCCKESPRVGPETATLEALERPECTATPEPTLIPPSALYPWPRPSQRHRHRKTNAVAPNPKNIDIADPPWAFGISLLPCSLCFSFLIP